MSSPGAKDAGTITAALVKYLQDAGVDIKKLRAFGSDGCSSMMGHKSGVSTRLAQLRPGLMSMHCAAHRLALVPAQAVKQVCRIQNRILNPV